VTRRAALAAAFRPRTPARRPSGTHHRRAGARTCPPGQCLCHAAPNAHHHRRDDRRSRRNSRRDQLLAQCLTAPMEARLDSSLRDAQLS
jgi:hypothetical protein